MGDLVNMTLAAFTATKMHSHPFFKCVVWESKEMGVCGGEGGDPRWFEDTTTKPTDKGADHCASGAPTGIQKWTYRSIHTYTCKVGGEVELHSIRASAFTALLSNISKLGNFRFICLNEDVRHMQTNVLTEKLLMACKVTNCVDILSGTSRCSCQWEDG